MVEILNELRSQGYSEDFNLKSNCLECRQGSIQLFEDQFSIDKVIRLEGESDPSDESVIYAISDKTGSIKGVLVNAYGIYSEALTDRMLQKLKNA